MGKKTILGIGIAIIIGSVIVGIYLVGFQQPTIPPVFIPPFEKKEIIYAESCSADNNLYGVLIDNGEIIIENSLTITTGELNGISVINTTKFINPTSKMETRLVSINLIGNTNLTLRNITDARLNIYLFDNSILTLENCSINSTVAYDSSKLFIINSNISYVSDYLIKLPEIELAGAAFIAPVRLPLITSSIFISQDSNITNVNIKKALLEVDNSSISLLFIYNEGKAKIKNSSILFLSLSSNSKANIYGTQINLAGALGMANLTLNASSVNYLAYGIICSSGITNINDGVPSGTYINNTKFIAMATPPTQLISFVVNNTAILNIDWLDAIFVIYMYDSAEVNIKNTKQANIPASMFYATATSVYAYENSSLVIKNSNISVVYSYDNSQFSPKDSNLSTVMLYDNSQMMMDNCTINYTILGSLQILTNNSVLIGNSTILLLSSAIPSSGSPIGNITVINTNITQANIIGSSVVTFEDCNITMVGMGYVVYSGTCIIDSNGISGPGSYINYTQMINCQYDSSFLIYVDVNNSARVNVTGITPLGCVTLYSNAYADINNATFILLSMYNNSNALIKNSSLSSGSTSGVYMVDNSQLTVENNATLFSLMTSGNSKVNADNSTIMILCCSESSEATLTNSTVSIYTFIYEYALVSIRNSTLSGYNIVIGSNSADYSLKLYNSSLSALVGLLWEPIY